MGEMLPSAGGSLDHAGRRREVRRSGGYGYGQPDMPEPGVQPSTNSSPASSLHSMLGGSSPGKARKSYCGVPNPRMSIARAGRRFEPSPNRNPESPPHAPYWVTPIV